MTLLEIEFENIIREYGGIITKICYSFAYDADEFKDLRQEVLYNIWKGLPHFQNKSKLSTWIYRVCLNSCITFQRKEKKFQKVSMDALLNLSDDFETPELEKYEVINAMIKKLGYEDRALILMWLDELSYEEISNLTGLNRNTVASRIKRIKEKLIKMKF
ncbi:MAG: sigma-70 family RNA polymerase sigma factor [Muribaculaceae bacterium]|nr:sigma-70 family RNA polymerase sigma factor [Muribaculaceae bacterium]